MVLVMLFIGFYLDHPAHPMDELFIRANNNPKKLIRFHERNIKFSMIPLASSLKPGFIFYRLPPISTYVWLVYLFVLFLSFLLRP